MLQYTERDSEILHWIQDYKIENGFPPSIREIGAGVHLSRPAVQRHLWKLCQLGFISMVPKQPRTIVIKIPI